jgi:hypothetical protein
MGLVRQPIASAFTCTFWTTLGRKTCVFMNPGYQASSYWIDESLLCLELCNPRLECQFSLIFPCDAGLSELMNLLLVRSFMCFRSSSTELCACQNGLWEFHLAFSGSDGVEQMPECDLTEFCSVF